MYIEPPTARLDVIETKLSVLTDKVERVAKLLEDHIEANAGKYYEPDDKKPESPCEPSDEDQLVTRETLLDDSDIAKINDIMENFDFEKVHSVMEHLDWKWAGSEFRVPSIEEIKKEAKRILVDAAYEECMISTGGFKANYVKDGSEDGGNLIALEFIIEEYEGFKDSDCNDDE